MGWYLAVLPIQEIKPLLAAAQSLRPTQGPQNPQPLDSYHQAIYAGMHGVFRELG